MLDKDTFNNFIAEAAGAWTASCVWGFVNNNYVKHLDFLDRPKTSELRFSTEKYAPNCNPYKNYFHISLPCLFLASSISLAKLVDPAFHNNDLSKPNLSLKYIDWQLKNSEITKWLDIELKKREVFISEIKELRHKKLAHNDLNYKKSEIQNGFHSFYVMIANYIYKIKLSGSDFNDCPDLDLNQISKTTEDGVNAIFSKII